MNGKNSVMFSKKGDEWETPKKLVDKLDIRFNFDGDAAATDENSVCELYYTKSTDALERPWFNTTFCNPPYSNISKFVEKAYSEMVKGVTTVMLIPARTDTKYFHTYCMCSDEIIFIKGRLQFQNRTLPSWKPDGSMKVSSAPFPSIVVVFKDTPRRRNLGFPAVSSMRWR